MAQNENGTRSIGDWCAFLMRQLDRLGEQSPWQGLDSRRGVVNLAPRAVERRKPEVEMPVGVQARVRGPHPRIRLAHRSHGILHRASSYGVTTGSDGTRAEALGKELEERNGVARKVVGVHSDAFAEGAPEAPGCVGGGGALVRDSCAGRLLNSAPINAKLVSLGRLQRRHGESCG